MSDENFPIELDAKTIKDLIDQGDELLLIDCREPSEHEHCRIEGAILIPMNDTPSRVAELESHRDQRIVVHCHHGVRSMQVVQWLRNEGFPKVQNMAGGIDAWSLDVDPQVARY